MAVLPSEVHADLLRELERAESRHTAARARVLAAFGAQRGYEADGQATVRAWLKWQTRVTSGAAAGAVGWSARLAAHPVVGQALAAGQISCSWAKHLCAWTDRLPRARRDNADRILCEAAAAGADLRDLAELAEHMYRRSGGPGTGQGDGFDGRYLRVGVTFGGAGRAEGDLTPGCAAALTAVLEALGKKAGPEDTRTAGQRRHDALEEACRRLISARMVPGRAGQPTQLHVHMPLAQLRGTAGAPAAERAWAAAHAGWLTDPAACDAAACDATVIPVVTGHVDWAALDRLATVFLAGQRALQHEPPSASKPPAASEPPAESEPSADSEPAAAGGPPPAGGSAGGGSAGGGSAGGGQSQGRPPPRRPGTGRPGPDRPGPGRPWPSGPPPQPPPPPPGPPTPHGAPPSEAARLRLRRALLALAVEALSGPGGLAAQLRASLAAGGLPAPGAGTGAASGAAGSGEATGGVGAEPGGAAGRDDATGEDGTLGWPGIGVARDLLASVSLPLDIGAATEIIPAHLRRAVAVRHPRCAFPGCEQPVSVCDVHHLIPRSRGGPTALANLVPLCSFHHLTAIHRWGWTLRLNPDGSTVATSPDRSRSLHSHGPPGRAA